MKDKRVVHPDIIRANPPFSLVVIEAVTVVMVTSK